MVPVDVLRELRKLALALQREDHIRVYILRRFWIVLPLAAAAIAVSGACVLGVARFLLGFTAPSQPWLLLPGFMVVAFTFFGALLAQLFVLFSWLEQAAAGDTPLAEREARFVAAFAMMCAFVALPLLLLAVAFRSMPAILGAVGVVTLLICLIYDSHG